MTPVFPSNQKRSFITVAQYIFLISFLLGEEQGGGKFFIIFSQVCFLKNFFFEDLTHFLTL